MRDVKVFLSVLVVLLVIVVMVGVLVDVASWRSLVWNTVSTSKSIGNDTASSHTNVEEASRDELPIVTPKKFGTAKCLLPTSANFSIVTPSIAPCSLANGTAFHYALATIQSFVHEDVPSCGWGDLYFASLEYVDGTFFIKPYILDLGNGSYSVWLPSHMLPVGEYILSVWLDFQIQRELSVWRSKKSAYDWPLSHLAARDARILRMTKEELHSIYTPIRHTIRGSHVILKVSCTEAFPGWLGRLVPCNGHRKPYEVFPRIGAWVNCSSVAFQKAPLSAVCENADLLLPTGSYNHVYTEGSCYYKLLGLTEFKQCVTGRRIKMCGDSTTQGAHKEAGHMWLGYERGRDYELINKSRICTPYLGRHNETKWLPDTSLRKSQLKLDILKWDHPTYRGGLLGLSIAYKNPIFGGISNLLQDTPMKELQKDLAGADIAIVHSCGHDVGGWPANPKKLVFQSFQAGLKKLVRFAVQWRKAGKRKRKQKRLLWMTCGYQVASALRYHMSSNPVIVEALSHLAYEAMMQSGFEFVDVTSANIAAVYQGEIFGISPDIHHFERMCPEHPKHASDYWYGGDVHLAKMEVQHVFQQICAGA